MRAVVLVGGLGTRLRPLTLSTPKQLLPIVHTPMLERVIGHLASHGVEEAVLSLGYRPDAFRAAYPDGACAGVRLHYAVEPEPRDTAGAIRFAALDAGIDERFLVINGDVLTDLDVGRLVDLHEQRGAEATIALHRVDDPSAFGVVPTDAEGRVTDFIEKPPPGTAPSDLINAGTYVVEPSLLGRIPPDVPVNVERVTFPQLVADGTLYALDGQAYWIDAGTPATYLRANLDRIDGVAGPSEAAVAADAIVRGAVERSVVGAAAVVEAGGEVARSVLLPGAVVETEAVVRDAIVGSGARIGKGARIEGGTIVGHGVTVTEGSSLHGARVPEEVA